MIQKVNILQLFQEINLLEIRKRDTFQIMYEIFSDENNKIIETGNILYANLYIFYMIQY